MPNKSNQLLILGETNFRSQRWRFGIKQDDRRRHMYVIGSTGMGKSEFLKNMAIQDIEAGRGLAFLDPHGDAADDLLDFIPKERIKDVIYLDPGDLGFPIAFNVMEKVAYEYRHLVASGLLGVFKKIFGVEVWSGRMEYILNNTILALLESPDSTLLGINRMLSNKEYRKKVVDNVKDPIVRSFWLDEFAKYTDRYMQEATPAIQNKIGQFISNNLIRNIIGQTHSTIDVRKVMDEGKILIVNLSRGKIGEDASRLLGNLLVTKIQLAAMSRVDIPERNRNDFHLYVDEFQHFATESFANILSEARKYHLSLIVSHQYINQMEEHVRDAVFGNVGTIVSFRVGAEDAEFLEKWFQPDFAMTDIVNLGKYNIYLKLMIDGVSSKGFSAQTLPPFKKLEQPNREDIIEYTRSHYATPRDVVDKNIAEWIGTADSGSGEKSGPRIGSFDESRSRPRFQDQQQGGFSDRAMPRREVRASHEIRTQESKSNFKVPVSRMAQTETQNNELSQPPQPPQPPQPRQPINGHPHRPVIQPTRSFNDNQRPNPISRPFPNNTNSQNQSPSQTFQPRQGGTSLKDALGQTPVNFRGRRMEGNKEKPKVEVDTNALKKALEEAMRG